MNTLPSLIDDVSSGSASYRHENLLVTGGADDHRLLQLLLILHAVLQSWDQLVVRQVIRRGAVHNHGDPVDVGLNSPSAAAGRQPQKSKSLLDVVVKVAGRLLVVVGGG